MPETSHPSYSNHTHSYTFQEQAGAASIHSYSIKTCPSGHTLCQVNVDNGVKSGQRLAAITWNDELEAYWNSTTVGTLWLSTVECAALGLDTETYNWENGTHLHTYYAQWMERPDLATSFGARSNAATCALGHTNCRSTGRSCIDEGQLTKKLIGWTEFSDGGSWSAYINNVANATDRHRHYYLLAFVDNNYTWVTSWQNCPSGHIDCQVASTENIPFILDTFGIFTWDYSSYYPSLISVTTLPCTSVGNKTAILSGQYTGIDLTVGIEYWSDENWKSTVSVATSGSVTDYVRSFNISGLAMGRLYYFRAFAIYESTYYYGDTLEFTTSGSTIYIPLHTEYNNARHCVRQIEKVALGRSYADATGQFVYESRHAREA